MDELDAIFFDVLNDLKDYLDDLTLVGGWVPYVYVNYLWNIGVKPIGTTDIDFGLGLQSKTKSHPKTIFEKLSDLDYNERHVNLGKIYPVVLYKKGKIPIHFIAPQKIPQGVLEKLTGREINVDKIEKFDFILEHRIPIELKSKTQRHIIYCPSPAAFLYHKAATFTDREEEHKKSKDLYYMYFVLRYTPEIMTVFEEIRRYNEKGYFKAIPSNLKEFFITKTSPGCLMVEKENGPDEYVDDLRQDIFERFNGLLKIFAE